MSLDVCFYLNGNQLQTVSLGNGDSLCPRCGAKGRIFNSFLPTDGVKIELCSMCKSESHFRISDQAKSTILFCRIVEPSNGSA